MRLYLIYPNQYAVGNKPIGISMLAAVLKNRGHEFKLFDLSQYQTDDTSEATEVGEHLLEFRRLSNPEKMPSRTAVSFERLMELVCDDIALFKPDIIGLSALTDDYARGLAILRHAREHFDIPTIVGGVHATVYPEGVINEECVDAICIGEGEEVVLELAEKIDRGEPIHDIKNLWVKANGQLHKNEIRPLIEDLDTLPYPDWSVFAETAFVKPYDGVAYVYGDLELSRGCVYKCSYCVNKQYQQIYRGKGRYHREKSVGRAIDEMLYMKQHYGIEFIKFWDETFLLMSRERLKELAEQYANRVGLPFVVETTAQSINEITVSALKKMGCKSASIGIETGSEETRTTILNKPTRNDEYKKCFTLLRQAGIRSSAFIMLGLPNETRESLLGTIEVLKDYKPDTQAVGIFFPYKGTPIYDYCLAEGLLDGDQAAEAEHARSQLSLTSGRTILRNSRLTADELIRFRDTFSLYVELPAWLYPVIDLCGLQDPLSKKLTAYLGQLVYEKRFEGFTLDVY